MKKLSVAMSSELASKVLRINHGIVYSNVLRDQLVDSPANNGVWACQEGLRRRRALRPKFDL
ncbi:MAG: hypothetical protein F4W92_03880 [Gammaproteobacteria bacterium]|nr:hypothetical protein [Gammaproteobacteria bacterium]